MKLDVINNEEAIGQEDNMTEEKKTAKKKNNSGRNRGIYKRDGKDIYWIRYAGLDGKIIRESSGSNKFKDAEDLLIRRKNAVRDGKLVKIRRIKNSTFKQLAEDYLKFVEKRQKSYRVKKYIVPDLVARFGNLPLSSFTYKISEDLQTAYINDGHRPSYINKVLSVYKHMFRKAFNWQCISEEQLENIRKVPQLKETGRLRYLSIDECHALITACDDHLRPIVITALNSGMRKSEILGLTYKMLDLKNGFILLPETKNGDKREIPINSTLKAVFKGLVRRLDVPYVFYDPATGERYKDVKTSWYTTLKRVEILHCPDCKWQSARIKSQDKAGTCPDCGSNLSSTLGIQDYKFHDNRHTFASHAVMNGVDLPTLAKLLGHRNIKMTMRYASLAKSHLVKAVDILDKAMGMPTDTKTDTIKKQGAS